MTIHKEGYASIAIVVLTCIVLNVAVHLWATHKAAYYAAYAISAFLLIMILQFFRNPKRTTPHHKDHIISSADGKVVVIEEVFEEEYFKDKRLQISVFMSPVNVHVNRYPADGIVKYVKYHAGKYLVAWHPKSSTENERTTIVTEDSAGRSVLFRQIAGAMARRIVYYCEEGKEVKQGTECGFIKFGSRVDHLLPLNAIPEIKIGDTVTGGETVLARFS